MRETFERILELIVVAILISLAILVIAGVAFRRAGSALVWYDEVASILLAWLTYYGASLAALKHAHIGFPTLVERLPQSVRKAVILVRELVVFGFLLVLAWAGFKVLGILSGTFLISLPWMPALVAHSVIPIGAILFILAEVFSLPERFTLRRKQGVAE